MSGNENKAGMTKEKSMSTGNTNLDYNQEAGTIKDLIPVNTEKATFALGWFWGPDARFGHLNGVIRTQVGYAGGTKKGPTYYSLGDHSETIEVEFDPKRISYEELLDIFWESHDPTARSFSRQYASFIFFHTDEQKKLAQETKEQVETKKRQKIYTEIVPADTFYPAEDYHQKYYLKKYEPLVRELSGLYAGEGDFTLSTAAARINGYLGGNGNLEQLKQQLKELDLSPEVTERIVRALKGASR